MSIQGMIRAKKHAVMMIKQLEISFLQTCSQYVALLFDDLLKKMRALAVEPK